MRLGIIAMAALMLAACDQVTLVEPDATWTGSIGRLVVDGVDPEAFAFVHQDDAVPEQGKMTVVEVDGREVGKAARLETLGQPPRMESLQARLVSTADIDADAACWLRFDVRAVQPQIELGLGRLSVIVRRTAADGDPLIERSLYVEPVWTPIDLIFPVVDGLDAGEAEVVFAVGTQLQVVDVADVSMRCFDDARALQRLPPTSFSYAGREPEAAWRATAESQIERYRKGDLTVEVKDSSGQPVADAEIQIQMSRHAFTFGAMIDPARLAGVAPNDEGDGGAAAYRKNLKELFNTVTFTRGLRWSAWADPQQREVTEKALAWVRSLDLDLYGQDLVSTSKADLPPALLVEGVDEDSIREAIRDGVAEAAADLKDQIKAWNVVDKPRDHHDLLDLVGWDELPAWFRLARTAAPEARLVLNESEILAGDRMAELATLVGNLIGEGVPLDRLGVEGRFGAQPPPIQVLSDRLDQLASFDLPLVITAFDMATTDQKLQQDFVRDFLTLAFSHPSVEGFIFGRFFEDEASGPGVALFRSDGTSGPIGSVYRDLVMRNWWTDIVALSNAEGALSSRVFQGEYMISARKDDLSVTTTLNLGAEGAKVTLTLAEQDESERAL
ncbi:MAG: endo-1,4-beta-xylanase [Alphaproteobacteria bacterium]